MAFIGLIGCLYIQIPWEAEESLTPANTILASNPALTRHSYWTLCLVQAVRQQYTSIGAACLANMATHKLRRTNRVESIRRMV